MITATRSGVNAFHNVDYAYDTLDRLGSANVNNWSAGSGVYAYDDAGNMTYNSSLCAGSISSPNISYPAQGVSSGHPHGPTAICGRPVTYDANGNITGYDPDGAGVRSLSYDGENRPISVTRNGNTTSFAYAPDGSRSGKFWGTGGGAQRDYYLSADADILVGAASPSGLATSWLSQDVKREGAITSWAHKDHLASNRVISFMAGGQAPIRSDYGAYGRPMPQAYQAKCGLGRPSHQRQGLYQPAL